MSDNLNVMTSQDLLYFSMGLGGFIWALFTFRGELAQPTRLRMRMQPMTTSPMQKYKTKPHKNYDDLTMSLETLKEQAVSPREKSLNVNFVYNGHNFEAHEILGLPAGARLTQIEEAYKIEVSKSLQGPQRDFVELAYKALKQSLRKSG